jgi:hypothetical protein
MSNTRRISYGAPVRVHHLVAMFIVAVLAFGLGLAAASISTRSGRVTTRSQPAAVALPAANAITGALYDDGWAGGPGHGYQSPVTGGLRTAHWIPCSECYDQGWAGGPGYGYQPPTLPLSAR